MYGVDQNESGERLNRLEGDVLAIRDDQQKLRDDLGQVKTTMSSFGAVLTRIEDGIVRAQDREEGRAQRARPNVVAIVSVAITLVLTIIGGAWVTGGQIAKLGQMQEADAKERDRADARVERDLDRTNARIDKVWERIWQLDRTRAP